MGPKREWRSRACEGRARSRRDRSSSASRSVRFRAEIGSVPHRDRFDGGAPGGRGREAGISARGGHFGASPTAASSDSRRNVDLDGNEAVRRRESFPHERRIAPRRARPAPRGRTRRRTVVPRSTRSYLKAPLQYDPAPQRTTTRIHVRPREPGYDRPEVTAAGPVGRTTARATAPPHDPPTAPDPTRPITPTPRPRPPTPTASRTARPSDNHHRPPITTGPVANRLTAQPRQTNRSRAGTRPNSSRN